MAHINEPFNGIIMNRRDYRERDQLVKILTNKQGPSMFLVRGARRKNFKMASDILPFTYGRYVGMLSPDQLNYIVAAQETHQLYQIGDDLLANAYATFILELADRAFDDGHDIGAWYDQILAALKLINDHQDPQVVANVLEVQLLGRFGVMPEWRHCVVCGKTQKLMDYSEADGGLLCVNHWDHDPHRLHLDSKTINYLRFFATLNLQKVDQIQVDKLVKRNLRWALDKIYGDQVGLRLKSKRFIDQMGEWTTELKNCRQ
ncbi:DNA repair protein RecO [uncultured Limosilactobacillus sp.]|uniref:DNA repair protein RecO n=1 Tax=uncultured Limosilactobacillus sp. TaxID=2837629 RepID=UPI0025FBE795|nr:DNA repair protein RecO [uncultured Limosilactobacillus sp.]